MPKNQIGASTSHDMPKCYEITCYSTRISILRVHLQTHSSKVGEACRTWPYFEGRAPKVQRREGGTERNKMGYYHHDLWLFKHVSTCFKMLPNTPTTKHQHFFGDLNLTTKNWQLRNTCGFSQEELVFYAENLVISPTKTGDVRWCQQHAESMSENGGDFWIPRKHCAGSPSRSWEVLLASCGACKGLEWNAGCLKMTLW